MGRGGKLLVFPAYAGMFLQDHLIGLQLQSFPRIRGDVPEVWIMNNPRSKFSPHTRGCSGLGILLPTVAMVFPAYAGMFL